MRLMIAVATVLFLVATAFVAFYVLGCWVTGGIILWEGCWGSERNWPD